MTYRGMRRGPLERDTCADIVLPMLAAAGSAGRNRTLSIKNFENIVIPLPALEEQRRIATHLDALDGLVDLMAKRAKVAQALPVSARNEIFSAMV